MKNKTKTVKSLTKRFRITKKGKILKLAHGKNHSNAKERGNRTRNKRRDASLSYTHVKLITKVVS